MSLADALQAVSSSLEYTKPLSILGVSYVLKMVSTADDRKISKAFEVISVSKTPEEVDNTFDYAKRVTISFFLKSIDGNEIPAVVEDQNKEKIPASEYLTEIMEEWPNSITDILYSGCQDLRKEYKNNAQSKVECVWFEKPLYSVIEEESSGLKAPTNMLPDGITPNLGQAEKELQDSQDVDTPTPSPEIPKVKRKSAPKE